MDFNQILTGKGIPFAQCERKRHEYEKLQIIYSCEWRKRGVKHSLCFMSEGNVVKKWFRKYRDLTILLVSN